MNIISSAQQLMLSLENLPCFSTKTTHAAKNTLLLTGATGFLGIHLLSQLVTSNLYKKIYIMVRNQKKLYQQIEYYHIPAFSLENVIIIEGDLKTLNEEEFPIVSHVIHSAATIHCIKPLSKLWDDNVLVTHKICEIYKHTATIYFISTLSVFVSSNQTGVHEPSILKENDNYLLYGGYAQSKYISEKIVERAKGKIIRLGLLTGSTFAGVFPQHDFFSQIINSLKFLKVYPVNYEESFVDLTPVDLCAKEIIGFIQSNQSIIHIANKDSLPLSAIIQSLNLQPIDNENFNIALSHIGSLPNTLLKFAFFKSNMLATNFNFYNIDLFQSTHHSYNIEKEFNVSNENLLQLYIENIEHTNTI